MDSALAQHSQFIEKSLSAHYDVIITSPQPLHNMYLSIESPDLVEHCLAAQLNVITEENCQPSVTFDLLLVEQTAVEDPVVIVTNGNVTGLGLNLEEGGEGDREIDTIISAVIHLPPPWFDL